MVTDVDLINCARCGGNHKVTFREFRNQPVIDRVTEEVWTHWGLCPITGEPILMRIEYQAPRHEIVTLPGPSETK